MGLNDSKIVTMDLRACPLLSRALVPVEGKRRRVRLPTLVPCIGGECALWMRYTRDDGMTYEACTFVLSTILQEQTIKESMRVQASVDKAATGIAAMVALTQAPLEQALAQARLEQLPARGGGGG